jgi:CRP-like cAMP-binding protein
MEPIGSLDHLIKKGKKMSWHELLIRKLREHSPLSKADIAAIQTLPGKRQDLKKNEDILRQGDKPKESIVVLEGMVARYHNVAEGKRQYLSFHMTGDMPDAQTIFLETMDFAIGAVNQAVITLVPHTAILQVLKERPNVGFALWRETLIDASIFRATITNNSSRDLKMRIAHFFCEHFYRANKRGLVKGNSCELPLTQTQLAETLASSLPSISRAITGLRKTKTVAFQNGILQIRNWDDFINVSGFNPSYLHLKSPEDPTV